MKKIREDRTFQDEGIDMPEEVNTDKRKGWMPLKTKWEAPSVQKAEHFADMNHPRVKVSEKFYRRFSLCETTTGRLCGLGGFGEQCDLWREGKWSEFTAFGPGVTMYFKFVKWAFWLFIILSCFAMPSLIINLFGPESFLADIGIRSHTLSDLARTSVGNLYIANETVSGIIFPFCSGEGEFIIRICSIIHYTAVKLVTYFVNDIRMYIRKRLQCRLLSRQNLHCKLIHMARYSWSLYFCHRFHLASSLRNPRRHRYEAQKQIS